MKKFETREEWLNAAMDHLKKLFPDRYKVPKNVRISCGLPSKGAFNYKKRRVGEAWSSKSSKDDHHELFISPTIENPIQVLNTVAHEMVHVTVGLKAGHRGHFIECARALGFDAPWTQTPETPPLTTKLKEISAKLGKYPHAELRNMTNGKKKQKTRLIKVGCPLPEGCGYTTRITMQWILIGVPTCPNENCEKHGEPFEVDDLQPPEEE